MCVVCFLTKKKKNSNVFFTKNSLSDLFYDTLMHRVYLFSRGRTDFSLFFHKKIMRSLAAAAAIASAAAGPAGRAPMRSSAQRAMTVLYRQRKRRGPHPPRMVYLTSFPFSFFFFFA